MRKILLSLILTSMMIGARADEGMWLPMLLDKKYDEMVRKGLSMTPDMIYSVNHSSLKDAIIQFGGGCTGEIVSAEGLILTNHHCGYSSIAQVSDVEHNYLKNGFWSKSKSEEIPIPGLTAKFLVKMEDVTKQVISALPKKYREPGDAAYDEAFAQVAKELVEKATKNTHYTAEVKPLYNGNQYFIWVYEIFTDVRLVGAPPENLGKFGGDTDNWMWPRHTADFSIFRVYANKNNEPGEYSPDNKPYKAKHYLPISIKGQKPGDFTMIMGYPGRTDRYESSYGVKTSIDVTNPSIVKLRGIRLDIMRKEMQKDPAVKLQLASKYASTANYWKYFQGQTEQLQRFGVIAKKKKEEKNFQSWAAGKKEYRDLFTNMDQEQRAYRKVIKPYYYYNEGLFTPSAVLAAYAVVKNKDRLINNAEKIDTAVFLQGTEKAYMAAMSSYNEVIDPKIFSQINYTFYQDVDPEFRPDAMLSMLQDMDATEIADFEEAANYFYTNSMFVDTSKFLQNLRTYNWNAIWDDPLFLYASGLQRVYENKVKTPVLTSRERQNNNAYTYLDGLLEKNEDKAMYPDANSTMRLSYGDVQPYYPRDAVYYDYFTTLEGLIEKYKPNDYEFDAPLEIIEMYKKKDYGRYADRDGTLHLCFLSTNDITGGNSGSPVINGKGELLGLAFDGNWEAMCGDIYFDSKYKRTISVDIRYVLWLIEKYGKAPNIISEMKLVP